MNTKKKCGIREAAMLDFILVRPYIGSAGIIMLFFIIAFGGFNPNAVWAAPYAMIFMALTISYPFSVTEKNGMGRLYGALPVTKKQLVAGRYLYGTVLEGILLLLSLFIGVVSCLIRKIPFTPQEMCISAAAGILIYSVCSSFQIPVYYKFGTIKGRVFVVAPFLLCVFAGILIQQGTGSRDMETLLTEKSADPLGFIFAALFTAAAVTAVSILFSMRIMEKKEL